MSVQSYTVAFQGMEAREVEVQCHLAAGLPAFSLVGLPDKAVAESKERVRAALNAIGLALPPRRITINLAPADLPKEGAHYDLPIALALLAALEVTPAEEIARYSSMGELSLDGRIGFVTGALPAALAAAEADRGFICPASCGSEAALVGAVQVLSADSLLSLINHFNGKSQLSAPKPAEPDNEGDLKDLADVKGQETARRALEVAAAGGHNMLMLCTQHPSHSGWWLIKVSGTHEKKTPPQWLSVDLSSSPTRGISYRSLSLSSPPPRGNNRRGTGGFIQCVSRYLRHT